MRVCVVGASTYFMSGLSYYTLRLSNALAEQHEVSAVLMRKLMPVSWYPGRERVGKKLTDLTYSPKVPVFDGVDWFWLPSLFLAIFFMLRQRPQLVIFQWWTGTVLHSYLCLGLVARLLGAEVIFEFHEIQDCGEAGRPLAKAYLKLLAPLVCKLAQAGVVHAEQDKPLLVSQFRFRHKPIICIAHGPYDQYNQAGAQSEPTRVAPTDSMNLLFFGLLRPYKGVDVLVEAFNQLPQHAAARFWLTIAGETWENFERPSQLIANSPYRDRITFINSYVPDSDVATLFSSADAVIFPYRRSSGSGVLQIALSQGLPVIVSEVGGLTEAVANYAGAIQVAPDNVEQLQTALLQALTLQGQRFEAGYSWQDTVGSYEKLYTQLVKPLQSAQFSVEVSK